MSVNINHELNRLLKFALEHDLIREGDLTWAANALIGELGLHEFAFESPEDWAALDLSDCSICDSNNNPVPDTPDAILNRIMDWAAEAGIIEDTNEERDLFDTRLMGPLTPRPSNLTDKFFALRQESPEKATDWFYNLNVASNYVRAARVGKNLSWKTKTEFGELDITINLSKPEKDPRDIAKARNAPSSGYPKCLLCRQNEGYFGRPGWPARQNIRLIPLKLQGRDWYFQYSPYGYYNEHCIVLGHEHVPMKISRATFGNLLDFVTLLPHYFLGSNADLPIVGGSILSHDHYQGGRYVFAMELAPVEKEYKLASIPDGVVIGRVNWPMSALRLRSRDPEKLISLAEHILTVWRGYSDSSVGIFAETENTPHNTITPISRRRGEDYELDLVLRNNRTSEEHPLGIFHPHANVHHIKKENIGLIEVMGLAVLPARLRSALIELQEAWLAGEDDLTKRSALEIHDTWYRGLRTAHAGLTGAENVKAMLRDEVGQVFAQVLRDSGVYKRDAAGLEAFDRFVAAI